MTRRWLVMWWPREQPIPPGWRLARQRPCHHHRWAVLLEEVPA